MIDDSVRLSNWAAARLSDEQIQYAALDAYASLKIYELLKRKRSSLTDFDKLQPGSATAGKKIVLLAKGADIEVAHGTIVSPPLPQQRGRLEWRPPYLASGGDDRYLRVNLTSKRIAVAIDPATICIPAALLPYPADSRISSIGEAVALAMDDGVNDALHVLWDVDRARIPLVEQDVGGLGIGRESTPAAASAAPVLTRDATAQDNPSIEDNWEDGLERDRQVAEMLRDQVPEELVEGVGGDDLGLGDGDEEEEDWSTVSCDGSHGASVKLDMLHAQMRIQRTLSKKHGAYTVFIARLRDAMMAPAKVDVEALKGRKLARGWTEEQWDHYYDKNYADVIKVCRRFVPSADKLLSRLEALEAIYAPIKDAKAL